MRSRLRSGLLAVLVPLGTLATGGPLAVAAPGQDCDSLVGARTGTSGDGLRLGLLGDQLVDVGLGNPANVLGDAADGVSVTLGGTPVSLSLGQLLTGAGAPVSAGCAQAPENPGEPGGPPAPPGSPPEPPGTPGQPEPPGAPGLPATPPEPPGSSPDEAPPGESPPAGLPAAAPTATGDSAADAQLPPPASALPGVFTPGSTPPLTDGPASTRDSVAGGAGLPPAPGGAGQQPPGGAPGRGDDRAAALGQAAGRDRAAAEEARPFGHAAASFADSVPGPGEVGADVLVVARNALLAILLLTLLALPIGIVNDVARENAHRFDAAMTRLRRLRLPVTVAAERIPMPIGFAVVATVSAVIYGFIAPTLSFDLSSLAMIIGMALAFLVVSLGKDLSRAVYLRRAFDVRSFVRLFPAFALIGVVCVLLSRLIGFQPGLILGTLAALGLRGELTTPKRGKATAVGAATLTVIGLLAWFLRGPVLAATGPSGVFLPAMLGVLLTAIAVAAAENLAFGLLPLTFLDGAPLFGWSKAVWAVFSFLGAFAFVHVLLQRAAGPFIDRIGYLVVLLVVYFAAAIGFWTWFRLRRTAEQPAAR